MHQGHGGSIVGASILGACVRWCTNSSAVELLVHQGYGGSIVGASILGACIRWCTNSSAVELLVHQGYGGSIVGASILRVCIRWCTNVCASIGAPDRYWCTREVLVHQRKNVQNVHPIQFN